MKYQLEFAFRNTEACNHSARHHGMLKKIYLLNMPKYLSFRILKEQERECLKTWET